MTHINHHQNKLKKSQSNGNSSQGLSVCQKVVETQGIADGEDYFRWLRRSASLAVMILAADSISNASLYERHIYALLYQFWINSICLSFGLPSPRPLHPAQCCYLKTPTNSSGWNPPVPVADSHFHPEPEPPPTMPLMPPRAPSLPVQLQPQSPVYYSRVSTTGQWQPPRAGSAAQPTCAQSPGTLPRCPPRPWR